MIRSCWSLGEYTTQEEHPPDWTPLRFWRLLVDPGGFSPPPGFLLRDMDCELELLTTLCPYLVRAVSRFYISSYYFLSGGYDETYLNDILSFNKIGESWQPAGEQMTAERYAPSLEVINDISKHCPWCWRQHEQEYQPKEQLMNVCTNEQLGKGSLNSHLNNCFAPAYHVI